MCDHPRETTCYSSSLLIKYAVTRGYDQNILFDGIEHHKAVLENSHEWTDFRTWTRLAGNFERAGGNIYDAAIEITKNQISHFQLLILKTASFRFLVKNFSKHFEKNLSRSISLKVEYKHNGLLDFFITPRERADFSPQMCDFIRGCAFASMLFKRLSNAEIIELSCAARSDAPSCRFRVTWTPEHRLIRRIKDFFLFRFGSQDSIFAHVEENYHRLQERYNEVKALNAQLNATLREKERLSAELRELNLGLERTVAEQTADIRAKNRKLRASNGRLRESERMKNLLTGALVHDIKNHIFSISSDVFTIEGMTDCPEEARNILRHTSSACSSAMSLAINILDIGKMEEGKLVVEKLPIDFGALKAIIGPYTKKIFFREKRISVRMETPPFPLRFEADRYLLDRVLQNLLTNAAMYTPEGGDVLVSFASPATIGVFNSGEPIPESNRNEIFKKYARVANGSKYAKGLGLFFCKLVMEAHGGTIRLECPENGNRFVLEFRGSAG